MNNSSPHISLKIVDIHRLLLFDYKCLVNVFRLNGNHRMNYDDV